MSENLFIKQAAPGISALTPYIPGKPVEELERELGISHSVKLASNENPLGPSPIVTDYLQQRLKDLSRYPDGSAYRLSEKLAQKHQCHADMITVGNGSNDVLDMIARAFLYPGRQAVFSEYSFAVYPISTQAVGATAKIAKAKDYGCDLDALDQAINDNTAVIFIANPNNPTGTWLKGDELYNFLTTVPENIIVVLDEAYVEFVQHAEYTPADEWLSEFPNLIVTRTFSKAYGLAGLRVGYSISHPDISNILNRVRQPFNVNSLALAAAEIALDDQDYIKRSVANNAAGMQQICQGLSDLDVSYIPSVANFLCVKLGPETASINQQLLQRGVIVRPIANYDMAEYLRVSIGLAEENQRFLDTLQEILNK